MESLSDGPTWIGSAQNCDAMLVVGSAGLPRRSDPPKSQGRSASDLVGVQGRGHPHT